MSVGGVPDRFKCFGCETGGDVIEYVSKRCVYGHVSTEGARSVVERLSAAMGW